MRLRLFVAGYVFFSILSVTASATDDPNQFNFPDYPVGVERSTDSYSKLRDKMETASRQTKPLSDEDYSRLKSGFIDIINKAPGDVLSHYAKRRLVLLDWQARRVDAKAASDQLRELALSGPESEKNLTWAMALTIDIRDRNFDRFQSAFSSLEPVETPQFGWFVFAYTDYLIDKYVNEGATLEESESGQPIPKEYQRSIAVTDFLEQTFLMTIQSALQEMQKEISEAKTSDESHDIHSRLERAQMAGSLRKLSHSIREVLARRIYLDISYRATESLLPRSLELWASSLELLDESSLEDPAKHREQIQTFQKEILPRLRDLQRSQRALRDQGR